LSNNWIKPLLWRKAMNIINDILKWCTWSKTYNNMWEKIICEMLIKRGNDEYTN
jgi:hypothetical protein